LSEASRDSGRQPNESYQAAKNNAHQSITTFTELASIPRRASISGEGQIFFPPLAVTLLTSHPYVRTVGYEFEKRNLSRTRPASAVSDPLSFGAKCVEADVLSRQL